jgi:hypothetical protein
MQVLMDHTNEPSDKRGSRTAQLRRLGHICEVLFCSLALETQTHIFCDAIHFILKLIVLPRQARESSTQKRVVAFTAGAIRSRLEY